jgi:hypothetical protein
MQQQARLVARRRRVDFVFVQLDALCPGQKSKVESPRNLRPDLPYLHFAFSTLVGHTIYASGEIGLLLSQYHYSQEQPVPLISIPSLHHSTRFLYTARQTMSGLKNSPFGKRLRATQQDVDEEGPRRSRPRTNPVFGVAPASTPSLDTSRPTTSESGGPESPTDLHRPNKDYGDRFVPSRDAGDLRTSYNLMEESGPSTPSRNRVIPTESDAAKGRRSVPR